MEPAELAAVGDAELFLDHAAQQPALLPHRVDVPGGVTDAATVLPVQIFLWSDLPEVGFQAKTSAAIIVLLMFLLIMNGLAILLRKRFERRW